MKEKAMRLGLGVLFLSSGVWLLATGLEFVLYAPTWWADWAWNDAVRWFFVHVSPVAEIAFTIGASFPNTRVDTACCIAGSTLYLVVAFVLLSGYSKSRNLIAFACWINTMSLVFKILVYARYLNFNPWLLLDASLALAFLFLGFRAHAGAFAP